MKRRNFMHLAVIGASSLAVGCAENDIPELDADVELDLAADYPELLEDGGFVELPTSVTAYVAPIFVERLGEGDYRALSSYCNHQGCSVNHQSDGGYLCPCHGASFTESGKLKGGPATRGLRSFGTDFDPDANTLTILA